MGRTPPDHARRGHDILAVGIFDIQIPLLYGEGRKKALKRLREEINKPLKDRAFEQLCEEKDTTLKGEGEILMWHLI
jgi:hypothetical protein